MVAVVVEGGDFVAFGVHRHADVDGGCGVALLIDEGVPDIVATHAARAIGGEVEHGGAVGQIAHGRLGVVVVGKVDIAAHFLGFRPFALVEMRVVDVAGDV